MAIHKRRFFKPRFETFEDRSTPSTSAVQIGTGIYVTGDRLANRIEVVEQAREVVVKADGQEWRFTGAEELFVDSRGGADRVSYHEVDHEPHLRGIHFDLGGGVDNSVIEIIDVESEALRVDVNGGSGDDEITIKTDQFRGLLSVNTNGGVGSDVMISEQHDFQGELFVTSRGGEGDDVMISEENSGGGTRVLESLGGPGDDVMISDENDAFPMDFNLTLDGGLGNDNIAARVGFNPQPDPPGDPMSAIIDIEGGGGNDTILARVGFNPQPDPPGVPLLIDLQVNAGAGRDVVLVELDLQRATDAQVNAEVHGGAGNDVLGFSAVGLGGPDTFQAVVDGDGGFDIARVARGIDVSDCEIIIDY